MLISWLFFFCVCIWCVRWDSVRRWINVIKIDLCLKKGKKKTIPKTTTPVTTTCGSLCVVDMAHTLHKFKRPVCGAVHSKQVLGYGRRTSSSLAHHNPLRHDYNKIFKNSPYLYLYVYKNTHSNEVRRAFIQGNFRVERTFLLVEKSLIIL